MTIRPATVADRATLIALGLHFAHAAMFNRWLGTATEATIGYAVDFMLAAGDGALVALAEDDAGPIGMLAVLEVPNAFTQVAAADELCWFVHQDRRGLRAGPRLMDYAETWARARGLTSIRMAAPFGASVGRYYERRGYVPAETAYIKDLTRD